MNAPPAIPAPGPPDPPFDREAAYRRYLDGLLSNNRAECRAGVQERPDADPDLLSLYGHWGQRSL